MCVRTPRVSLRFYEEDIVLHVVKQTGSQRQRVYKLLQRGEEDDVSGSTDMTRITRSSHLGKNPFGDAGDDGTDGLEPE